MVGTTLGGGVGRYSGLHGMLLDSLLNVQMVTAAGKIITVSTTENSKLFWGVRGAGFNYGTILEAKYSIYNETAPLVLNADFLFAPSASRAILKYFETFENGLPAKLSFILLATYSPEMGGTKQAFTLEHFTRVPTPQKASDSSDCIGMTQHLKPIAVCGIGLRLPGGITTTEDLWEALQNGKDMRTLVPESRYRREGFSDVCGSKNAIDAQHGYFLDQDLACFDNSLFSLTEEEVKRADPQQRILLEVVKECFENAGEIKYRGKNIGCYVGTFGEDWLQSQSKEDQHSGGYIMSGQIDLMLANRVSYENDLRGPSTVIKTGCSASLVAFHEACRAIQTNDCDGAVVAGTNLILGPSTTVAMTSEGILSPEGSCKTFDSKADGFARGEAVTAVYIQSLEKAIEERLPIRAVIANTGVNCDGRSRSILQPSAEAQSSLMSKVYFDAGLDPCRTAFVECHGTGTPTGDPIEAAAVGQVFGGSGVYIGSLKPNLGHSEGASGISSLLKSIVMLEHSMIVPNIKFLSPNPNIDFEKHRLEVPEKLIPWPRDRDFRVSINSFGIGGSNAHVIVEHPYMYLHHISDACGFRRASPHVLLMSASTVSGLQTLSASYNEYVSDHSDTLPDLAYTLACRREHYPFRTFAVCSDDSKFLTAPVVKTSASAPGVTMIFGGQGAQWARMGHELLEDNADFLQAIKAMDQTLKSLLYPPVWSIETELKRSRETSRVDQAEVSQPLCTAVQIALCKVLSICGVRPNAVVGHSSGEIAAAHATGAISMEEAIIVAYYRGLVTRDSARKGSMAAIGLDSETARKFLKPGVVIACENSPSSTTLSGDEGVLLCILEELKHRYPDILARQLNIDMAYHSHHMHDLSGQYLEYLLEELESRQIRRNHPTVPMFSSVWDQKIVAAETFSADYWVTDLVSPVRFHMAITNVVREKGDSLLLEIGPHSILAGPLKEICSAMDAPFNYSATMKRYGHCTHSFLSALGMLYQHGVEINWSRLIPEGRTLTDIPRYPWNHRTPYWYESRLAKAWRSRLFGHHELLGLRVPQTTDMDPVWRVILNVEDVPWLADHQVKGDIVFPFAAYASMAGEALRQVTGIEGGYSIRKLSVATAMVLDRSKPLEVVTSLHHGSCDDGDFAENIFTFSIASYSGSAWVQHGRGIVGPLNAREISDIDGDSLPRRIDPKDWYSGMAQLGLEYGPSFRRIDSLSTSTKQMFASATLSAASGSPSFEVPLHTTIIDTSFQVGLAAQAKGLCRNFTRPYVPTYLEQLDVGLTTVKIACTASYSAATGDLAIDAVRPDGNLCLRSRGMRLTQLADDALTTGENKYGAARLEWVPDYEFQDIWTLIKAPASSNHEKQVVEELSLLCIVESREVLKDLKPSMPHLEKYRSWLRRVAEQAFAGEHPVLGSIAAFSVSSPVEERNRRITELCEKASLSNLTTAFIDAITRVRNNIRGLFTGSVDPLELLLHDNNLARIYDTISFDYSDFICSLCDAVPNMRILEIGAGTGGTTALILRGLQRYAGLPRYAKYTFTDISAGFFPSARERFAGAPNLEFRVFDISQDPFQQGFESDSYDLILAANVVHATPNLHQTLRNLQPLLATRGRLVLTEFCTRFRAPNYIYGHFSGWWLGEADDREWEPYVDIPRWGMELRAAGFSDAIDTILDAAEPWQYCTTIVARVAAEEVELTKTVTIVGENADAAVNQGIMEILHHEGLAPRWVALKNCSELQGDIIVTLDLESNFFDNISKENLGMFQKLCHALKGHHVLWLMPLTQVGCVDPRGSERLGMVRTARCELNLLISSLEIDPSVSGFGKFVTEVFYMVRSRKDCGSLVPDREFAVHEKIVKVGRYRSFSLQEDLERSQTSPLNQSKFLYEAQSLITTTGDQDPRSDDIPTGLFRRVEEAASPVPSNATNLPLLQNGLKFDPNATYMITGGLGGLGRAISIWLAEQGARKLLFLSPNAGLKPRDSELFAELESLDCTPIAVQGAVQNILDVFRAIQAARAPIKGVLHLAMQLRDAPILDMTYDDWTAVNSPKVAGTWNLHDNLGDSLVFFVMFSSMSTVLYQPGQSNYNAANTFMESFCQYRHSLGMPASVLNVCPIEGIGYVAENSAARRKLKSQGHWFLAERALLEFLELAILKSNPQKPDDNSSGFGKHWDNPAHIVMGLRSETPLEDPNNRSTWRRDRRMGQYHNVVEQKALQAPNERNDLEKFLIRVENQPDSLDDMSSERYLAEEIGRKIFNFNMRPEDDMTVSLTLAQIGLDSLMAIEIRRWWNQVLGFEISIFEIMNSGTIAELGTLAADGLKEKFADA
ncbi:MAG: hypothetical protein Q9216_001459 [Gyalolechia sp. 2 TL-2023]